MVGSSGGGPALSGCFHPAIQCRSPTTVGLTAVSGGHRVTFHQHHFWLGVRSLPPMPYHSPASLLLPLLHDSLPLHSRPATDDNDDRPHNAWYKQRRKGRRHQRRRRYSFSRRTYKRYTFSLYDRYFITHPAIADTRHIHIQVQNLFTGDTQRVQPIVPDRLLAFFRPIRGAPFNWRRGGGARMGIPCAP